MTYDNKVIVNGTITIKCPASGVPPPIILWYKDGQELDVLEDRNLDIRLGGTELVIHRADIVDSGQYSCVATNPAGEAADTYQLNVQGKLLGWNNNEVEFVFGTLCLDWGMLRAFSVLYIVFIFILVFPYNFDWNFSAVSFLFLLFSFSFYSGLCFCACIIIIDVF